ncbi:hypothetical protein HanRHA438_Chr01g0010001 [Helianthus annuus]|nr:hypothetical protein HanRHA438_Chr01g0010001 [Helianthus annuus]
MILRKSHHNHASAKVRVLTTGTRNKMFDQFCLNIMENMKTYL